MSTRTISSRCLCGAAKHEVTLAASHFPLKTYLCHCNSCRHMTGALCLTVTFLPPEYEPSTSLLDKLVPFVFSKRITEYHCRVCGTQLLARCLKDGDDPNGTVQWDVSVGTLEQADGILDFQGHEWLSDTRDGGFSDFLRHMHGKAAPRWPGHLGQGSQLPLPWRSSPIDDVVTTERTVDENDRLHAYCKCNGVEFWIARPSERSRMGHTAGPDVLAQTVEGSNPIQNSPDGAWWIRDGGKKFLGGVCSCDSCRLDCGMEWSQWAFIPTVDISLDAAGLTPYVLPFGTLQSYQSSKGAMRYFCKTCGATVFYVGLDRIHVVDVAVGLLDAREGARAESWLEWRTNRISYREDSMQRSSEFTLAVEAGMKAYEQERKGEMPSEC